MELGEIMNGLIFRVLFKKRFDASVIKIINKYKSDSCDFKLIEENDLEDLYLMLNKQDKEQFEFFKPHNFDKQTLKMLFKNPSFFMFGVFVNGEIIGYFFLRCFINKKSFTGRIVDQKHQGKGIARRMGIILHNFAWINNFRVFGTASKKNTKSLRSYSSINNYRIIRELKDDYIYFEYLKDQEKDIEGF